MSGHQDLPTASTGPVCPQALGSHRQGAMDRLPLWASFSSNTNLETHITLDSVYSAIYTDGLIRPSEPTRSSLCPDPTLVGAGGTVHRKRQQNRAWIQPPAGDAIGCSAENAGRQQPMASTAHAAKSAARPAPCTRGRERLSGGHSADSSQGQVRLLPGRAGLVTAVRLCPQ